MDFAQFASVIRNLVNGGLAPAQIRLAAFDIIGPGADAALALAAERDPVVREALAASIATGSASPIGSCNDTARHPSGRPPRPTPPVLDGEVIPPKAKRNGNGGASRARGAIPPEVKRARALVREQLRDGPRPGAEIEAAAQADGISKYALIAATDALGVRTKRGEWRLPG